MWGFSNLTWSILQLTLPAPIPCSQYLHDNKSPDGIFHTSDLSVWQIHVPSPSRKKIKSYILDPFIMWLKQTRDSPRQFDSLLRHWKYCSLALIYECMTHYPDTRAWDWVELNRKTVDRDIIGPETQVAVQSCAQTWSVITLSVSVPFVWENYRHHHKKLTWPLR